MIRYLVFKNWSGNHLSYDVTDNGYKYRFTNGKLQNMIGWLCTVLRSAGESFTHMEVSEILWLINDYFTDLLSTH